MWFDGVVTGLTAAAFAVAFALGAALRATQGDFAVVATNFAYPVADLLLVLVAAALTLLRREAGASWWWLSVGLALFVVTDRIYAYQVARGTYVWGSWRSQGSVLTPPPAGPPHVAQGSHPRGRGAP